MEKLELELINLLRGSVIRKDNNIKYMFLEEDLLCLVQSLDDPEIIIIRSHSPLSGMGTSLFELLPIEPGRYLVSWKPLFHYLTGGIEEEDLGMDVTNSLRLVRTSNAPLNNFIRIKDRWN